MAKWLLAGFIALVLFLPFPIAAQDSATVARKGSPIEQFDPKRDAARDIRTAIAEARRDNKNILLDVGGQWCIWCRRLDTLFHTNQKLSDYLHANYVVVKVNFSKENENKDVLSKYPDIPGYPHFFVLDKNGKLLKSQDTGELESGKHHDPAKVMAFLKKWSPNAARPE